MKIFTLDSSDTLKQGSVFFKVKLRKSVVEPYLIHFFLEAVV